MSTATMDPAQETVQEPIPHRSDIVKAERMVFMRHLAHEAMMLEKMQRQNRRVERFEKFAATGDTNDLEAPEGEDEEMGVAIGNEYHYHTLQPASAVQSPPSPGTATATAPSPANENEKPTGTTPATAPARTNWLLPAAIGAACLVGGAGLGSLMHHAVPPVTPTTPNQRPADQFDYRYGIEQRPTPK